MYFIHVSFAAVLQTWLVQCRANNRNYLQTANHEVSNILICRANLRPSITKPPYPYRYLFLHYLPVFPIIFSLQKTQFLSVQHPLEAAAWSCLVAGLKAGEGIVRKQQASHSIGTLFARATGDYHAELSGGINFKLNAIKIIISINSNCRIRGNKRMFF